MHKVQLRQILQLQQKLQEVQTQKDEHDSQYAASIQKYQQQIKVLNEQLKQVPLMHKNQIQQLEGQNQILSKQVQEQEQQYMLILKLNDEHITTITRLKDQNALLQQENQKLTHLLNAQKDKYEQLTVQKNNESQLHEQQRTQYEDIISKITQQMQQENAQYKQYKQWEHTIIQYKQLAQYLLKTIQYLIIKMNDNIQQYVNRIGILSHKVECSNKVIEQYKQKSQLMSQDVRNDVSQPNQSTPIRQPEHQQFTQTMISSIIQYREQSIQTDITEQEPAKVGFSNEFQQQIIDLQNKLLILQQQNSDLNAAKIKNVLEIDQLKRQVLLSLVKAKQQQILTIESVKQEISDLNIFNSKFCQSHVASALRIFLQDKITPSITGIKHIVSKMLFISKNNVPINITSGTPTVLQNTIRQKLALNMEQEHSSINQLFKIIKERTMKVVQQVAGQLKQQQIVKTDQLTKLPEHIQFKKECYNDLQMLKTELNELTAKKGQLENHKLSQMQNLQIQLTSQKNKLITLQQQQLKQEELNQLLKQLIEKTTKQVTEQQKNIQNKLQNIKIALSSLLMCKINPEVAQNLEIKFMKQQQLLENLTNDLKSEKTVVNRYKQEIYELKMNRQQILNVNSHLERIQFVINKISLIARAEANLIDGFVPETISDIQQKLRQNTLILINQQSQDYGQLQKLHDIMLANYSFWKSQFGQCILNQSTNKILHQSDSQLVDMLAATDNLKQDPDKQETKEQTDNILLQSVDKSQHVLFGNQKNANDQIKTNVLTPSNCFTVLQIYSALIDEITIASQYLQGQNIYGYFISLFKRVHSLICSDQISVIFPGTELLSEPQTCQYILQNMEGEHIPDLMSQLKAKLDKNDEITLTMPVVQEVQYLCGQTFKLPDFFLFSVFMLVINGLEAVENQNGRQNRFPALRSQTYKLDEVIISTKSTESPETTVIK